MAPVEHVIVDTGGFIRVDRLQNVGQNIYTVQEVISEITHKATKQKLRVLPYDLKVLVPSDEAIEAVEEFAEKTGDYDDLSTTDMKVLALTYMLERQFRGTHRLKANPRAKIEVTCGNNQLTDVTQVAGFFLDQDVEGEPDGDKNKVITPTNNAFQGEKRIPSKEVVKIKQSSRIVEKDEEGGNSNSDVEICEAAAEECTPLEQADVGVVEDEDSGSLLECDDEDGVEAVTDELAHSSLEPDSAGVYSEEDARELESVSEEVREAGSSKSKTGGTRKKEGHRRGQQIDDEGWITPGNIYTANSQMRRVKYGTTEKAKVRVGCITTDFGMQNVLLQMGLNVITPNGRLMKQTRSYVLMCYSCETQTKKLNKEFCDECGNRTMRKVSVTVGDDGSFRYYIPHKPPRTPDIPTGKVRDKRGLKYIFTADQKKPSRKAPKNKENHYGVFEADYITNKSPFEQRDVQSRAAQLGWGRDFDKRHPVTTRRRRRF